MFRMAVVSKLKNLRHFGRLGLGCEVERGVELLTQAHAGKRDRAVGEGQFAAGEREESTL